MSTVEFFHLHTGWNAILLLFPFAFFFPEQITSQQCLIIVYSFKYISGWHRFTNPGLFHSYALHTYDWRGLSSGSQKYSLQIKRRWITLKTNPDLEQCWARSGFLFSQRQSCPIRFHEIFIWAKINFYLWVLSYKIRCQSVSKFQGNFPITYVTHFVCDRYCLNLIFFQNWKLYSISNWNESFVEH